MKNNYLFLFLTFLIFSGVFGQNPDEELKRLNIRNNYFVEISDSYTIKLTNKITRQTRYINIRQNNIDFNKLNTNEQIIDLRNVDTTLYYQKYKRYRYHLLVGSVGGYPMVIGDFNNNGQLDFAGTYTAVGSGFECAIVQLREDTVFQVRKVYHDSVSRVLSRTDVDGDGLNELNLRGIWSFDNYESKQPNSYPDSVIFNYRIWEVGGATTSSEVFFDLDRDSLLDVLHNGDDSLPPIGQKIFIAEYDSNENKFIRKFSHRPPEWRVSGFSVGDFDDDGFMEFATGSIDRWYYVYENTGNDSYQLILSDTIEAYNAYMTTATNDIDGNGHREFFIGGNNYYNGISGTHVYWFEADGNNNYIKVRSFYLLGTSVLGTTELYAYDVNIDGIDDLVFVFSELIIVLIWNNQGYFDLFYYDYWENIPQDIQSVNFHTIYNGIVPDLFVNVTDAGSTPYVKSYYYAQQFVTSIKPPNNDVIKDFHLYQNFPNPFNNQTVIQFSINKKLKVNLTVYDIAGKEVVSLIKNIIYLPGSYRINWNGLNNNGKEVSSGVYLYELKAGSFREIKKMEFIR